MFDRLRRDARWASRLFCEKLRTKSHAALQRQGLAGHILEVGHSQLDADTADLRLSVAVVAHGGHLDVGLESVGVGVPELLELGRPCQRADHVDVDAVFAPLGGGDAELEIGRVCVQLAMPDFKYMSGETLTLEGGMGQRP